MRRSRLAFAVAKLKVGGADHLLLNAHRKWRDWSLVGGHVEPTDADPWAAAAREASEELAPLWYGVDMEVRREQLAVAEWGPVPSTSAGSVPTNYQVSYYLLELKSDPKECLARLPPGEFRLVLIGEVERRQELSSVARRLGELLPGGWESLPLSWNGDLDDAPLLAGP